MNLSDVEFHSAQEVDDNIKIGSVFYVLDTLYKFDRETREIDGEIWTKKISNPNYSVVKVIVEGVCKLSRIYENVATDLQDNDWEREFHCYDELNPQKIYDLFIDSDSGDTYPQNWYTTLESAEAALKENLK